MKLLIEVLSLKVLFLIPVLLTCEARIKIEINVESESRTNVTRVLGDDNKLITEKEVALFNITKENLLSGFEVELGRKPEDVFLRDPTPYDNLFEKFEWPQVKRNMRVKHIKVLHIQKDPIVLRRHEHINNTTVTLKSVINALEVVEHTVSSNWSEYGMPADETSYDVILKFDNANFKYSNTWRNDKVQAIVIPFGYKREDYVDIHPGQIVTNELSAFKTIILLEVDYVAKLIGNVIGDYENLYGKYHFYSPTVENIMRAAGIRNEISTKELLEIRCYSGPKLRIYDNKTGKNLKLKFPAAPSWSKKIIKDTRTNKRVKNRKEPEVFQVVWE